MVRKRGATEIQPCKFFVLPFVVLITFAGCRIQSPKTAKPTSEIFQALNYFGLSRTYPFEIIPAQAHYSAWERWKNAQSRIKSNPEPQWESLGPYNFAGRTLKVALNPQNPNTLYAGSASGGLWRSHSAGRGAKAWHYVPTGFPVLGVSSIAFPPNDSTTIFIGTGEVYNVSQSGTGAAFRSTRGSYGIGILKSADGGRTWTKSLDWTYNQNEGIWDIVVAPKNPKIVYAATTDGVYKSTDSGDSWTRINDVSMATSLLVDPRNENVVLFGAGNFNSFRKGIYKTLDGGVTWNKASSGLPRGFNGKIQLEQSFSHPNTVYASIGNGFGFDDGATWTCKSTDLGESWELVSSTDYSKWQGWFAHDIAVHPENPDLLVTGGISLWKTSTPDTGLMKITSNGLGFSDPPIEGPDGPENYIHSDIHDVLIHPTNGDIIYVASDGGIHASEDGGITFESRNGGYNTVQFYNGTSTSGTNPDFYIGGLQDNGTIAFTGTARWARISGGDGSWSHINPLDDLDIIVSSQGLNMKRSTDGGQNFTAIRPDNQNENTSFIAPFVADAKDGTTLYAGRSRIYKSHDRGETWVPTNSNRTLDGSNPVISMAVSSQNAGVVYAATAPTTLFGGSRGQVFVTRDGGNTWSRITGILPVRFATDMAVDPFDESVAYIAFSGFGSGHLYKTSDYGKTWRDIGPGLPDVPTNAIAIDPASSRVLYVGNDLGVFVSTDGGDSWNDFNGGLFEAVMVFDLVPSSTSRKIRLASHGNGVYERDMLEVPSNFDPDVFFALKAYPNPVRSVLNINFKISQEGLVEGRLWDMTGKLVHTFSDEIKRPGEYFETIDASFLASGQYLVQLSNTSSVLVEKVTVVR